MHRTSGGRYYTRVGSTKRDLTPMELARLFQQRGREYVFDEEPVHRRRHGGPQPQSTRGVLRKRSPTIPWLDLLRNTRVTFPGRGWRGPPDCGWVARLRDGADRAPGIGVHRSRLLRRHPPLPPTIWSTRSGSPAPSPTRSTLGSPSSPGSCSRRWEKEARATGTAPAYDLDVVDEAIVNAVAHRDYAIAGSKIRLFLFADRLELYSPGKLPNTITLDDMPYRTFTRNQILVSFLLRLRSKRTGQVFLESRGEGVRKILEDGEAHSGRRPEYELFGDELRLTHVGQARPAGNRLTPEERTSDPRLCDSAIPLRHRYAIGYRDVMETMLGSVIRQARKRAGLTRSELSKRAGTSRSAITRYEAGHATPMLETARRLVETCGFDLRIELSDTSPQREAATDAALARSVEDRLRTNDSFTALAAQLRR